MSTTPTPPVGTVITDPAVLHALPDDASVVDRNGRRWDHGYRHPEGDWSGVGYGTTFAETLIDTYSPITLLHVPGTPVTPPGRSPDFTDDGVDHWELTSGLVLSRDATGTGLLGRVPTAITYRLGGTEITEASLRSIALGILGALNGVQPDVDTADYTDPGDGR